jgi:hypothetical protein
MRVIINGRVLSERVEELEQREQEYFKVVSRTKRSLILVIGAFIVYYVT